VVYDSLDHRIRSLRWLAITWVNHSGVPLVKVVPMNHLDRAVSEGVGFSPVADAFGAAGGIDPAHRLARPDGDLRLRVDPLAVTPLDPASGWGWAAGLRWDRLLDQPYDADQRSFCSQQQRRLEAAGLHMRAGFELEWSVLVPHPDGSIHDPVHGGPYGADRLVDGLDYATALLEGLDAAELPWLQFHPEYGPGQFEVSLAAGSVLEAADRCVRAKLVIQRVTTRMDWRCSFSPKPRLSEVGNGGHVHLSVSCSGRHLLQGGDGPAGLTPAGCGIVAAVLEHLPALLPLACPLSVSYQRLAPGAWSAPYQAWGIENRETALRLIPWAGDGAPSHLELKICDLTANPYLLLGGLQAAVLEGFERPQPLSPPVSGDPAYGSCGQVRRLPSCLEDASAAFASSAMLQAAMGPSLHGSLLDSQAAEVRRCAGLSPQQLVDGHRWWPLVGGL